MATPLSVVRDYFFVGRVVLDATMSMDTTSDYTHPTLNTCFKLLETPGFEHACSFLHWTQLKHYHTIYNMTTLLDYSIYCKGYGGIKFMGTSKNPWFLGLDIAKCIGYNEYDCKYAIFKHVKESDKCTLRTLLEGRDFDHIDKDEADFREEQLDAIYLNTHGVESLSFSNKSKESIEFMQWFKIGAEASIKNMEASIENVEISNYENLVQRLLGNSYCERVDINMMRVKNNEVRSEYHGREYDIKKSEYRNDGLRTIDTDENVYIQYLQYLKDMVCYLRHENHKLREEYNYLDIKNDELRVKCKDLIAKKHELWVENNNLTAKREELCAENRGQQLQEKSGLSTGNSTTTK